MLITISNLNKDELSKLSEEIRKEFSKQPVHSSKQILSQNTIQTGINIVICRERVDGGTRKVQARVLTGFVYETFKGRKYIFVQKQGRNDKSRLYLDTYAVTPLLNGLFVRCSWIETI